MISAQRAREMDSEASSKWGLHQFSLVESAGRTCGEKLLSLYPDVFRLGRAKLCVLAGPGNNGADALVMLRFLILKKYVNKNNCYVIINKPGAAGETSPRSEVLHSLEKIGVAVAAWETLDGDINSMKDRLDQFDFLIDGICGTGLENEIRGIPLEMVNLVNAVRGSKIISIDVPSGFSGSSRTSLSAPAWAKVHADCTLAIEPLKSMLFTPANRIHAGTIVPVEGVFPGELMDQYCEYRLWSWAGVTQAIPPVPPDAYKYTRGVVSVFAGARGTAGAAVIAANGARAAGAGLVRLMVDEEIYLVAAANPGGIMVAPVAGPAPESRFNPDTILLGPGWGRDPRRVPVLRDALKMEADGTPVVLDADAIYLSKEYSFQGNTLITPHPGELSWFADLPGELILENPVPVLLDIAQKKNVHILFKSHVMFVVSPGGQVTVVDGMTPALGAGGSGDLLAGLCAGIIARMKKQTPGGCPIHDGAAAAASLLVEAGKRTASAKGFFDPACMADTAAKLAGDAWLPINGEPYGRK